MLSQRHALALSDPLPLVNNALLLSIYDHISLYLALPSSSDSGLGFERTSIAVISLTAGTTFFLHARR